MRSRSRFARVLSSMVLCASACHAATISGTVKGIDGAPFQGAFVEAQNTKSRITTIDPVR